ncbi:MAG: glycine--tRNA ligase, partial [Phycisphaerales bacterium]|nr:glycine--tRNA ligase [Phycisphaerales bacterium]
MSEQPKSNKMEKLVALCKRRGFIFQSSEIYGGINGFWDYGPLGVELKKNLKDAWWHDIVRCPAVGPTKDYLEMVGLDCTIIMNPKVWVASGHVGGFNDPMVDDKETKQRFRADHLQGLFADVAQIPVATIVASNAAEAVEIVQNDSAIRKACGIKKVEEVIPPANGQSTWTLNIRLEKGGTVKASMNPVPMDTLKSAYQQMPSPFTGKAGSLTEPRQFNLMFETYVGALRDEDSRAYLRPETAQGIFANFRNVLDTSRVKVPFGIAQVGKAFRNEVTPRNYTFRSREFEQMEIEFFIHPDTAHEWYKFWRDSRFAWWQSIGLASSNLQLREHDKDELAHYAKEGAGTSDIEYKFPFTDPGFGELEGVAHRTDFDLRQHAQHSGLGDKLKYFDQDLQVKLLAEKVAKEEIDKRCKYFPHVIEPSAGADRGTLALLCEAYTDDPSRPSGVVMKFHPRMAPI